jgi:hypothetical protein
MLESIFTIFVLLFLGAVIGIGVLAAILYMSIEK